MARGHEWRFGPFRVDVENERLWHGSAEILLRPKSFAVLRYLLAHASQLVARENLARSLARDHGERGGADRVHWRDPPGAGG